MLKQPYLWKMTDKINEVLDKQGIEHRSLFDNGGIFIMTPKFIISSSYDGIILNGYRFDIEGISNEKFFDIISNIDGFWSRMERHIEYNKSAINFIKEVFNSPVKGMYYSEGILDEDEDRFCEFSNFREVFASISEPIENINDNESIILNGDKEEIWCEGSIWFDGESVCDLASLYIKTNLDTNRLIITYYFDAKIEIEFNLDWNETDVNEFRELFYKDFINSQEWLENIIY